MPKCLYAHTLPRRPESEWQLLSEHAAAVADLASRFAEAFGSGLVAEIAGRLHDFGKALPKFQTYLRAANDLDDDDDDIDGGDGPADRSGHQGKRSGVKHSGAGAALAAELYGKPFGKLLAYLIIGHHTGLPDGMPGDKHPLKSLKMRLPEAKSDLDRLRCLLDDHIAAFGWSSFPSEAEVRKKRPPVQRVDDLPLWVRMLFSCLIDADRLDTERFQLPEQHNLRGRGKGLSALRILFNAHMEDIASQSEPSVVNTARSEILAACRAAAAWEPGIFSLTAPTGGGKTKSAMAFALEHAIRHDKRRIVFVIPYTSIIEQTARVFSSIFGSENVLEHHGNIDPNQESRQARLAAENWDSPIIVTTNVQFFESLYASHPSRCRKLHRLVNSVIVLDEAQLIPPELRVPCVDVIRRLTTGYGATAVMSTATQPPFPELKPREIVPEPAAIFARLRRTRLAWPSSLDQTVDWDGLAGEMANCRAVLCIVNRKRDAFDLWGRLPEENRFHLSTWMCAEHRHDKLERIKTLLIKGETVRVVSTQLVEAGVDVDFPVVFRALAGLDSLAQAAGRCNREGGNPGLAEVRVFVPPEPPPPGPLRKGADAVREMRCYRPDLDMESSQAMDEYFRRYWHSLNGDGSAILEELCRNQNEFDYPFRTLAEEFRLIRDDDASVLVRYGNYQEIESLIQSQGLNRDNVRRAARFVVSVPRRKCDDLLKKGLVEKLVDNFYSQSRCLDYNCSFGLAAGQDGIDPSKLMA